jgi:hypothetical protein
MKKIAFLFTIFIFSFPSFSSEIHRSISDTEKNQSQSKDHFLPNKKENPDLQVFSFQNREVNTSMVNKEKKLFKRNKNLTFPSLDFLMDPLFLVMFLLIVLTIFTIPTANYFKNNKPISRLALIGFFIALTGIIVTFFVPWFFLVFGIIGVAAIVIGISAKKSIKKSSGEIKGKGFANASIIMGIIMCAVNSVLWIFMPYIFGGG